jgi:peptidoglycan/xylan/chitin deacetylase (PgdA/CDA1 family)
MKTKLFAVLTLMLALSACNLATPSGGTKTTPPPPAVATVTVTAASSAPIIVGGTVQVTATAYSSSGSVISGATFSYTSNSATATVSTSGLVTAVSAGTASISACDGTVCTTVPVVITITATSGTAPTISRLSPPMAMVSSTWSIPVTITGTNFTSDSVVNGFGSTLTPVSSTATSLTVEVPQSAWNAEGTLDVTVSNSIGTSAALPFLVTSQGFVSIPFDDGYENTLVNGSPILDAGTDFFGRQGTPYTWYIITSKPSATQQAGEYFASWAEIKQEATHPNVEIGNHTRTHNGQTASAGSDPGCPILFLTLLTNSVTDTGALNCIYDKTPLASTTLEDETQGAQNDLEAQGFNPVTFAYPYGDYDVGWDSNDIAPNYDWPELPYSQQTVELAINAITVNGMIQQIGARTTDFGANQIGTLSTTLQPPNAGYTEAGWNPYAIPSFEVNQLGSCALSNPNASDATAAPYIPGCPTSLQTIQYWSQCALAGQYNPDSNSCPFPWTIITFHQVDPTQADAYADDLDAVTVPMLQSVVNYFVTAKIPVVTMAEGYAILGINGRNCPGTSGSTADCNADSSAMVRGHMPIAHVFHAVTHEQKH